MVLLIMSNTCVRNLLRHIIRWRDQFRFIIDDLRNFIRFDWLLFFFVYRGSPNSNFCKHHSCGYFLRFFFWVFFFLRFFSCQFFSCDFFPRDFFSHLRVSMYSYLKIRVFFCTLLIWNKREQIMYVTPHRQN